MWKNIFLKTYRDKQILITKLNYWKDWQKHYHKEYKSWSTKIYICCGRTKTPHSKGHCFSWWERTVVWRTPSHSGTPAVLGAFNTEFGGTIFFSCWGLNFKWWFACSNRACMSHLFSLGRGENGPDKEMVYLWISNFKKAGQILEALIEAIRKEYFAIAPEIDLNFLDNYSTV